MTRLIGVVCLFFALSAPVAAQNAACNIDLSSTVSLLVQAQAQASSGDTESALTYIALAQRKLDGFEALCGTVVVDDEDVPPIEIALTQSYTMTDFSVGSITFSYPEAWAQGEDGGVLVGTSPDVLDRDFDNDPPPFFPGEALIYVDFDRVTSLSRGGARTTLAMLTELAGFVPPSFGEISEPATFTVNDRPAARFTVIGAQTELVVMAVEIGQLDGEPIVAQFILLTAPGEQALFEPTLLAVAESIEYQAP